MSTITAKLIIRLDLGPHGRLGPGKQLLLQRIGELGSISAAARTMSMSYRQAWDLVHQMNEAFDEPVVISQTGGKSGGGATLTAFGRTLVAEMSAMQAEAERVLARHVHGIERKLKPFTGTPAPKDHDDDAAD